MIGEDRLLPFWRHPQVKENSRRRAVSATDTGAGNEMHRHRILPL